MSDHAVSIDLLKGKKHGQLGTAIRQVEIVEILLAPSDSASSKRYRGNMAIGYVRGPIHAEMAFVMYAWMVSTVLQFHAVERFLQFVQD